MELGLTMTTLLDTLREYQDTVPPSAQVTVTEQTQLLSALIHYLDRKLAMLGVSADSDIRS